MTTEQAREPDADKVYRGLQELAPFIRYRNDLESPEQAAATLAAILYLLEGQTLETARLMLGGAAESYESLLAKRASRGRS